MLVVRLDGQQAQREAGLLLNLLRAGERPAGHAAGRRGRRVADGQQRHHDVDASLPHHQVHIVLYLCDLCQAVCCAAESAHIAIRAAQQLRRRLEHRQQLLDLCHRGGAGHRPRVSRGLSQLAFVALAPGGAAATVVGFARQRGFHKRRRVLASQEPPRPPLRCSSSGWPTRARPRSGHAPPRPTAPRRRSEAPPRAVRGSVAVQAPADRARVAGCKYCRHAAVQGLAGGAAYECHFGSARSCWKGLSWG
mmetsp:Transcript_21304/g.53651  ORF Transcript_21304/g.53651 Transcript_21304/m.53651 type:complete len:250 (+) Transcript_21304:663-1412(+)